MQSSSLTGSLLPRIPDEIEKGLTLYEGLDDPEKREHIEVVNWTIHKAGVAYDRKVKDMAAFTLGCNPTILKALLWKKFPIEKVDIGTSHRIIRVKIAPNDLPIEPESSWCNLL